MSEYKSKYKQLLDKNKKEGKTVYLDGPEHMERIKEMNKISEEVRRSFIRKQDHNNDKLG